MLTRRRVRGKEFSHNYKGGLDCCEGGALQGKHLGDEPEPPWLAAKTLIINNTQSLQHCPRAFQLFHGHYQPPWLAAKPLTINNATHTISLWNSLPAEQVAATSLAPFKHFFLMYLYIKINITLKHIAFVLVLFLVLFYLGIHSISLTAIVCSVSMYKLL